MSSYWVWKFVIGVIVFWIMTGIWLLYKEATGEIIKKIFKKKNKSKKSKWCKDLKYHSFFWKCRMLYMSEIHTINIEHNNKPSKARKKMFTDMLEIKLKLRHDWLLEFFKKIDRCNWDTKIQQKELIDVLWEIIDSYEAKWRKSWIPEIVINKFRLRHSKKVEIYWETIAQVFEHDNYDTLYEKFCTILTLLETLLIMTKLDAQSTIWDLNWEISGLNYRWMILE